MLRATFEEPMRGTQQAFAPLIPRESHPVPVQTLPPGTESDVHRSSLHAGAITLTAQAIRLCLQILSNAVLARLLTPEDYGLIAMVTAVIGLIGLLKDCGLSTATIQVREISHAQLSTLFWINSLFGLAVAILCLGVAPVLASFYAEPRLTAVTATLSINFALSGLATQHLALLRRNMRFGALAVVDISSLAMASTIGLLLALCHYRYWALVWATLGSSVTTLSLAYAFCRWVPSGPRFKVGIRSMLVFGGHLTGFNILNYFVRNFDNILIGSYLGPLATGTYTKAYALLTLPIDQINSPINSVMLPALSRLQDDREAYRRLYIRSLRALSLITIPMVVFSFVSAPEIVAILLGPQWTEVVPIFRLLAPAALVGAINIAPGWLCTSLGNPERQLHYGLVASPLCVAAFFVGIHWGLVGVATSFSVSFSMVFWGFCWYASRNTPVSFRSIVAIFASTGIPAVFAGTVAIFAHNYLAIPRSPVLKIAMLFTLFTATYISLLLIARSNRVAARSLLTDIATRARSWISRNEIRRSPESVANATNH